LCTRAPAGSPAGALVRPRTRRVTCPVGRRSDYAYRRVAGAHGRAATCLPVRAPACRAAPSAGGDAGPRKALWSHDEPVILFGAELTRRGRAELEPSFDQHSVASRRGAPPVRYSLRVTTVLRREHGGWRVVHRHGGRYDEASRTLPAALDPRARPCSSPGITPQAAPFRTTSGTWSTGRVVADADNGGGPAVAASPCHDLPKLVRRRCRSGCRALGREGADRTCRACRCE
jgi:hypothetical protein